MHSIMTQCQIIKHYSDGRFLIRYVLAGRKRYEVVG